jgi:hypothetical protein
METVQTTPTALLLQEYRDILLALGADRANADLSRRADNLEQEVNRRMAW